MSGTPFRTTDPTREWWGRNTSPSVDPGAGNPVSKPGQLQCACAVPSKRGNWEMNKKFEQIYTAMLFE